jgi:hypothetical protein
MPIWLFPVHEKTPFIEENGTADLHKKRHPLRKTGRRDTHSKLKKVNHLLCKGEYCIFEKDWV